DERVEDASVRHPQPRHDGDAQRGEQLFLVTTAGPPRDLAPEARFRFLRDAYARLARLLAEALDARDAGGGARLVVGVLRDLGVGQRTDPHDLVPVVHDLGRLDEPCVGHPALEPRLERRGRARRARVARLAWFARFLARHADYSITWRRRRAP